MTTALRFLVVFGALVIAGPAHALTLTMEQTLAPLAGSARDIVGQTLDSETKPLDVAVSDGAAAQAMIVKLGDRAMAAIADTEMAADKKKQLFRQILSQNFDMPTIGRFALGRYWRQATPAQQQEYLRLYEKMVIDVYTSRFNRYSGQKFIVTGNRIDDSGDAVVASKVVGKGSPVVVDWRVRSKGGAYRIIDVMVEGVSMAVTQRNDFAGVIQQGGGNVQAVIDYLKKGGTSDVDE